MTEFRYAVRQLVKSPGFTCLGVIGLALGIGANVALFSVVNSVFLRPLPYSAPEQLVRLSSTDDAQNLRRAGFSYPRYRAVTEQQRVFTDVGFATFNAVTLTERGDPRPVQVLHASANLPGILGVAPVVGRAFSTTEDQPGGERVVLLSHGFWTSEFARDPAVLGRSLTLDGAPYTIVGVLPAAATATPFNQVELWIPRPAEVPFLTAGQLNNGGYFFSAIARLMPGVTLPQAAADMDAVAAGYRQANAGHVDAPSRIEVVPLLDDAVGDNRRSFVMLLAAVGCVLLIACANIANLLLSRFVSRRNEIGARIALGASRAQVVRQLTIESVLVAAGGGALGVLLAQASLRAIVALGEAQIPRALEVRLDAAALGFAVLISGLAGLAIGVLPAWQAAKVNPQDALRDSNRGSSGAGHRLRAGLLVFEIALSLVLMICASLLLTSFARLQRVDPGFDAQGIFTAQLVPPVRVYRGETLVQFYRTLYERLSTLPGITSAALTDAVPLTGGAPLAPVAVVGRPLPPLSERPLANRHLVSPKYFATMRIALKAGRDFDERDSNMVPHVAIVNETFVKKYFPADDPIGQTLVTGMGQLPSLIVGVVADVRSAGLDAPPEADYFLPALQRPENFTNVLVRGSGDPAALAAVVRAALKEVDPNLPLIQPQPLGAAIAQGMAARRLGMLLLSSFAGLALVLACLGIYAVMAHLVTQRTSEIGIRMALGARPGHVRLMVLSHALRLGLVGVVVGVAAALAASRLLTGLLFAVGAAEPSIYAALSAAILLVAAAACWSPAQRATRIDPLTAVRSQS